MRSRKIGLLLGLVMCLFIIRFSALAEEPETVIPSDPETEEVTEPEEQPAEEVTEVLDEGAEQPPEETELVEEEPEETEIEEEPASEEAADEEPVIEEEPVFEEEGEPAEEMTVNVISWEELLEKGILEDDEEVVLSKDTVLPEDSFLMIQGGTLTINPSASLTLKGLLIIQDGTLLVTEGAEMNNEFFVMVSEKGALEIEGTYTQAEEAALVWEDLDGDSKVRGVSENLIDKTIFVSDLNELNNALSITGYRTLTIQVSDQELVNGLNTDIPDGVVISAR